MLLLGRQLARQLPIAKKGNWPEQTSASKPLGMAVIVSVSGCKPPRPFEPGNSSVGRRNEYWRWLRLPLGKKMASSV